MIAKQHSIIKPDDEFKMPIYLQKYMKKNDTIIYTISHNNNQMMFFFENCEYSLMKTNESKNFILSFTNINKFLDRFTEKITTKFNEIHSDFRSNLSFNKIRLLYSNCDNYSRYNKGIKYLKINNLPEIGHGNFLLSFKIYADTKNKVADYIFNVYYLSIGNIISSEFLSELCL